MTRDDIQLEISNLPYNNILLELSTSLGKSKAALMFAEKHNALKKCLVVIPKLTLIKNWKDEILKWGYDVSKFEFSTYLSLMKHTHEFYDTIFWDECHHLSEKALLEAPFLKSNYNVLMSATVGYKKFIAISYIFKGMYRYTNTTRDAIDNGILSEPKVILCPLTLDKYCLSEEYVFHKNAKEIVVGTSKDYWTYSKNPKIQFRMKCTQQYYYNLLQNKFNWAQNHGIESVTAQYGGKILNFCAKCKTDISKQLLKLLKDYRTLTFCGSIEQTNKLGKYAINSKNKRSDEYIDRFNNLEIKHINSIDMLSEGFNARNVSIGIWIKLNTSERLNIQKSGRIYRSDKPIFIVLYYKNTREELAVEKFTKDVKPENIYTCDDITKIKMYL